MKIASLLLAAALVVPAVPARAAETILGNKDVNLSLGYNLWLNQWTTALENGSPTGTNTTNAQFLSMTQGGNAASNFTMALRVKRFFSTLGFLVTPDYAFPRIYDGGNFYDYKANRNEVDWNVGFMFVPQLGATMGFKGVTQKFWGKANNTTTISSSKTMMNGVTFGLVGSAAIGKGFSLYGNGAGGIMTVRYDPVPNTTKVRNDTASYESAELGVGWKAPNAPFSAKFGYKFQKISTKVDEPNFRNQRAIDLTTGYILGLNLLF